MRRPWIAGIIASLFVHVVILGVFVHYRYGRVQAPPETGPRTRDGRQAEPAQPDMADVIRKQEDEVAGLSQEERLSALKGKVGVLDGIAPKSVDSIAAIVERIKGVDRGRRYAPDPTASGRFDTESASLYDIRETSRDGRTVYEFTYVDQAGRTIRYTMPEDEMSAEDRLAHTVFDMARRSPRLRRLVDSARMIGETRIEKADKP